MTTAKAAPKPKRAINMFLAPFIFAYLERVFATRISFLKPLLKGRVRNVK